MPDLLVNRTVRRIYVQVFPRAWEDENDEHKLPRYTVNAPAMAVNVSWGSCAGVARRNFPMQGTTKGDNLLVRGNRC